MRTLTDVWTQHLRRLLQEGDAVAPRGLPTRELLGPTLEVDMRHPVLTSPLRAMHYGFMAGETAWVLGGDNTLAGLGVHAHLWEKYSDDGRTLAGAYGPPLVQQLPYVVQTLREEPNTRQAGVTLWRPSPRKSKDIPCTIALWFYRRGDLLHAHVFMRSSDAWIGLPYDVFLFSMIAHRVCAELNWTSHTAVVSPGTLRLTMGSSHLYQQHWEVARTCLETLPAKQQPRTPPQLYQDPRALLRRLSQLSHAPRGSALRWWEH